MATRRAGTSRDGKGSARAAPTALGCSLFIFSVIGGILFVSGDDHFARRVFEAEGRAYWSSALPLVLEKHGLLNVTVRGPEALRDPGVWDDWDVILIARLAAGSWDNGLAARAPHARAGVIIEGPVPAPVARELQVEAKDAAPEGTLTTVSPDLHDAATGYGHPPSARVREPSSRPVQRDPELHWERSEDPSLTPRQAAAWRAPGWDASTLTMLGDAQRLADWLTDDGAARSPAVIAVGGMTIFSFGVFAFLGQQHTVMPFGPGQHRAAPRCSGLETLLLALIDRAFAHAGATRARVLPWPAGASWALGIRHDYDRRLPQDAAEHILARHSAADTRATWYWRARHCDSQSLAAVAAAEGQEIALHTERIGPEGQLERGAVERAAGSPVRGSSAHGAPDSFGFQGAPNVLWADSAGFAYTEFIGHAHFHPHRCALLAPNGCVYASNVLCLPHHESFDRAARDGDTFEEALAVAPGLWCRNGGYMQLMNHPDINVDSLFAFIERIPREGRLDWTADQVSTWWRRTHVRSNLAVSGSARQLTLHSRDGVSGLAVELRHADGETEVIRRDLEAGHDHSLALPTPAG